MKLSEEAKTRIRALFGRKMIMWYVATILVVVSLCIIKDDVERSGILKWWFIITGGLLGLNVGQKGWDVLKEKIKNGGNGGVPKETLGENTDSPPAGSGGGPV